MEDYDVAHLRVQGIHRMVDLIILFVDPAFGTKSPTEQSRVATFLQARATRAGLAGNVALVWDAGLGRMAFWALKEQHGFFQQHSLGTLRPQINTRLRCG